MILETLVTLAAILAVPLAFLLIRWRVSYGVLNKHGIKGPSPMLYYGNSNQIRSLGLLKFLETNIKEYGGMFGYYVGIRPTIVVNDLEMLKQIMVKQFDSFIDRQHNPDVLRKPSESKARSILSSRGHEWRRMRKILSKSFNTINLSKMLPMINDSCDSLVTKFGEHADTGKSFEVWSVYGLYTLEVILKGGFGHNVDVINGEADILAEASASIFIYARGSGSGTSVTTMLSNFPFLEGYVRSQALKSKAAKNYIFVEKKAEELVENRIQESQESQINHQDMLQLLIDARADSDDEDENEYHIDDPYRKKLTNIEIVRTTIGLLLAGHETTSNSLGYVSYLLALHPEKQDKLYEEISNFFASKPEASLYEAAHSLSYLDMVLQETLRMFPAAPITTRHVSKNIEIKGQMFPKDSVVMIPIMAIHHLPDLWPEPSVFKPERFSKDEKEKRHPMAHMPFGWGPRSCIGMRLALMEAKMALIALMKEYKFVEAPETEKPLKTSLGITMSPTNGIYLILERR